MGMVPEFTKEPPQGRNPLGSLWVFCVVLESPLLLMERRPSVTHLGTHTHSSLAGALVARRATSACPAPLMQSKRALKTTSFKSGLNRVGQCLRVCSWPPIWQVFGSNKQSPGTNRICGIYSHDGCLTNGAYSFTDDSKYRSQNEQTWDFCSLRRFSCLNPWKGGGIRYLALASDRAVEGY